MTGLDEFLEVFGNITLSGAMQILLAFVFLYMIYKKLKKYLDEKNDKMIKEHEANLERDKQLQEALASIREYPKWHQQSIDIREKMDSQIKELRDSQKETLEKLNHMEECQQKLELNKLRDRLLQSYRYYTDKSKNPDGVWTKMEAEAFWGVFGEYEDRGGNGYMHSVVQPAMNLLHVVDVLPSSE